MRIATDARDLRADPVGRYLVGRAFLYFFPSGALNGFSLWGRPDRDDIDRLIAAMGVEDLPDLAPHASLVDSRFLVAADPTAFARLGEHVAAQMERYARVITRQAVVRPSGFAGAVVAGFFDVLPVAYPVQVFAELSPALRWLGAPAALAGEIDRLRGEAMSGALLPELQGVLAGRLDATVADAARALHVSVRTLQRRLTDAQTHFGRELHRARIAAAQALIRDTDQKLTAIALQVGYPSLQHFARWFRQLAGEAPSVWRERRR